ncbi:MAG: hypothetical protein GC191_17495 [Azospirillum sp.]|nr:hypothetical protein [Azospirillum sp.]
MRNVTNLVPAYDPHGPHAGVGAALEFGVLGHSQCGGIHVRIRLARLPADDRECRGAWGLASRPMSLSADRRTAAPRAPDPAWLVG